jgi:transposase
MITYAHLRRNPHMFQRLSGITVEEFDRLYAEFEPVWVAAERVRLQRAGRKRAIGGGGDYKLELETHLLMALVWLRLYLTTEALGYFFGISQSAASRNTRRLLAVLHQMSKAAFTWSEPPPRGKGRSAAQLKAEEPDLFAILDATEQPLERPKNKEREHLAYSGKRRRSTCKDALIVNEQGLIRAITPTSVLGRTHDLTQIRNAALLETIPKEVVILADAGYDGLAKDLPEHKVATMLKAKRNHPLQPADKFINRALASVRIIVENVFCQLKHFRSLVDRFRHDVEQVHSAVFAVVAMLVNRRTRQRLVQQRLAAARAA